MRYPNPKNEYDRQIDQLNIHQQKLLRKKRFLSWLRLIALLASLIGLWQLWNTGVAFAMATFILFIILFLSAVLKDLKNKDELENTRLLIQINKKELEILNHQFYDLPDGHEFKPGHHAYANDLDIFGKASVYQYINRSSSEQGNKMLASWLLNPSDATTILKRQHAAKELSGKIEWRQQFRTYGISHPISIHAENKIESWLKNKNRFLDNKFWKLLRFVFPVIALTILALYLFEIIPGSIFYPASILLLIIAFGITKIITPYYLVLNKIVPELETLQNSIRWMEESTFQSELMNELKDNFKTEIYKVSATIKNLKKILERLDFRYNPMVHIPLNTFLLWDLQQVLLLEKWKTRHHQNITEWFRVIANTEAIISIATLSFNHPQWSYPVLSKEKNEFVAEDLGHPLIPPEKCIVNSFSTKGEKQLNLITGSNMAGKSTFLRSIGVNIVLAMMGAPTYSSQLKVSIMKVISSMRVNDNLEENTSTFYAELKKLKEIIDAVTNQEKVFLILDEILRGTNSADRHTGSIALIKQLIRQNASGLIATHDLELAKLSEEFAGSLHNYHFDVQVKNEELDFDYKIKKGICTSMNASLLMKKIGIDL